MELKSEEKEFKIRFHDSSQTQTLDHHHHQYQPLDKRPDPQDQISKEPNPPPPALPHGSSSSSAIKFQYPTTYKECLKNHAAAVGGNVLDGCGEFMPGGEEGSLEALKCAACGCHRNFHRKEATVTLQLPPPPLSPPPLKQQLIRTVNHWTTPMIQPVKMSFAGTGGGSTATDSSSEDLNFNGYNHHHHQSNVAPPGDGGAGAGTLSKKRHRTKFTQEQKEKMMEFAEKVGWRIPREDDVHVQRFCGEVGVKRQVFKVWMHNNKSSVKQQQQQQQPPLS